MEGVRMSTITLMIENRSTVLRMRNPIFTWFLLGVPVPRYACEFILWGILVSMDDNCVWLWGYISCFSGMAAILCQFGLVYLTLVFLSSFVFFWSVERSVFGDRYGRGGKGALSSFLNLILLFVLGIFMISASKIW